MKLKHRLYLSQDGWRWQVRAGNNKLIAASSESYTTKAGAVKNLKAVGTGMFITAAPATVRGQTSYAW